MAVAERCGSGSARCPGSRTWRNSPRLVASGKLDPYSAADELING